MITGISFITKGTVYFDAIRWHNPESKWYNNTKLLTALIDRWFDGSTPYLHLCIKNKDWFEVTLEEEVVGTILRKDKDIVEVERMLNKWNF